MFTSVRTNERVFEFSTASGSDSLTLRRCADTVGMCFAAVVGGVQLNASTGLTNAITANAFALWTVR